MIAEVPDTQLLRLIDEPVIGLDPAGRYRFVNPAALHLKGLREADLIGRSIWDVFPEGLGSTLHEHCTQAERTQVPGRFEGFHAPLQSWFEVLLYPCADGLWLIFRDITGRKRSECALVESEQRFRTLFEDVPVALYRTTAEGKLLDVNRALVSMLGYPDLETFLCVNAADVYVDPADRQAWQDQLDRGADVVVFEMRDRRYDGSIIWVRDTASAVRDVDGRILYYHGMLEDITDRKEAEETLRESEARFRLLAMACDDVIWDWDIVTGEVVWNAALKTVFGFQPDDMGPGIERSYAWWVSHVHVEDRARAVGVMHTAVHSDSTEYGMEYRFRRLDGSYARVVERAYIGRDDTGTAIRMIGSIIDLDRPGHRAQLLNAVDALPKKPPVSVTSDSTLVAWIDRGSEHAFEDLYSRHASFAFAVAQQILHDTAETEEAVADVFLQVWRSAGQYDRSKGTVTAWVASIARARALDRVRKTDRRQRLAEAGPLPQPAASVVADKSVDPAMEALLLHTLTRLPDPQRRVIELAYFSGLTHADIARQLELPLGTVKTRLRAGIEKLRKGFDQ